MPTHFERMLQLADDIFATKDDPEQLDVDQDVLERLRSLHPSTVSEYDEGEGPAAWILLIPTTLELMQQFLDQTLSEKALFESTLPGISYEALYLCSAMVLEEYRRKGIAKRLTVSAIEDIRKEHPLKALFVWTFSEEGRLGAEAIARLTGLPLHHRGMPATS
ncbi:MAG: GNAT family N-acetyltransferase [Bacteroidetes bacterium]|nr:MAG: GNAT family N-acetyltransferase [Bacteroidota bacterium]